MSGFEFAMQHSARAYPFLTGLIKIALVMLGIGVLSVQADTVTLKPAADTGLFQNAPNNNLGAQGFMPVGVTSLGSKTRGLVRFDFAGKIPTNAVINSATLTLRVVRDHAGSLSVDLHRMLLRPRLRHPVYSEIPNAAVKKNFHRHLHRSRFRSHF